MSEKFQIPGVAAIVQRQSERGIELLVQSRDKADADADTGLLEIPAGKIRQFENLFSTLRREVFEETGLRVTEITGEAEAHKVSLNNYQVLSCEPFCVSQNISGHYPIMTLTFLCWGEGELLRYSSESSNIHWMPIAELAILVKKHPDKLYPMHIYALTKYLNLHKNASSKQ
ncbi:MAG: hypothetical protein OFPI_11870 [Osedax symbiont Rs2]|nr:MAG: hypothetical protein OFPI_11870 [Osedax symbiont Rs2]